MTKDSPEVIKINQNTLSGPGEEIGVLPDGRKVVRYQIEIGSNLHNHFIYMENDVVTVNHEKSHGKADYNHVEVFIDNQKFSLVPMVEKIEKSND